MNPIEIQKHLKGASYPASKDDLAKLAESNGAPDELVESLRNGSTSRFDSPSDVQKALA
jgi:Protein of unknown function (DUF2795)